LRVQVRVQQNIPGGYLCHALATAHGVDGEWNKDDTMGSPAPASDNNAHRDFSHTHTYELLLVGWFVAMVMARGAGEGAQRRTAVRETTRRDGDDVTGMQYNGTMG
jgi:hypothetical protein